MPRDALRRVYARALPFVHQVDHAVPLALGGLHCVRNLLVLTRTEHARKTAHDAAVRARLRRDTERGRLAVRDLL